LNRTEKVDFVHAMLHFFEENIHALPDVFLFVPDRELSQIKEEHILYSCRALWLEDDLFYFAVKNLISDHETEESLSNLLLCYAVDVLTEEFQYFARQWRGDAWFYNSERSEEYTPKSLAKVISGRLYDSVSIFYTNALGLDFDTLTAVAEMKYEKDAARGRIVLSSCCDSGGLSGICTLQRRADNKGAEKSIALNEKNARLIRRLFAGAGGGGLLFVQDQKGQYFYHGYVKEKCLNEMFTIVELDGKGGWTLCLAGQKVFTVKGNRVYLPPFPLMVMKKELERVLGLEYVDMLPALRVLSEQKHGTSVVFMNLDTEKSHGAARMDNLVKCGRAFMVEPVDLQRKGQNLDFDVAELLKSISRIDGAVIVDYPSRSIRYTNAIVDGKAMPGGRPDAGARHNALYGFIETLKEELKGNPNEKALAFVFSEDGDISSYSTIQ